MKRCIQVVFLLIELGRYAREGEKALIIAREREKNERERRSGQKRKKTEHESNNNFSTVLY